MKERHWSDEDFLDLLYGVGPADKHLGACADCMRRWERFQQRRKQLRAAQPEITPGFLAAQRRRIQERLEQKPHSFHVWPVPSLAAALLLLAVVLLFRPATQPPAPVEVSDTQVFEKVFTLVSTSEPRAVEPLRSLFEVSK